MRKKAIVIGAGILGLATARALAEKNYQVSVFDKSEKAKGASIRNFGMVWPIGQPTGILLERALRSRSIWVSIAEEANIWNSPTGSLHLAYNPLELQVIQEFVDTNSSSRECEIWSADKVSQHSPASVTDGLLGALWSPTELIVDPREAIAALPQYLSSKYGIEFHFGHCISRIEHPCVYSGKSKWEADLIVVCSGEDFETLYPEVLRNSGMTKCKLQMMRTYPQENNWRIGPSLCGGLTLGHYDAFSSCQSLPALKQYFTDTYPEYIKWGIHVMISQTGLGEVTIGDTHEYGFHYEPFDLDHVNQLILDYLYRFAKLKTTQLAMSWNGTYAKLKGQTEFINNPESGVFILNGVGGAGMTMSFGLAEEWATKHA